MAMMPEADTEPPYEGAKEMLPVDNLDDKIFLSKLIDAISAELPALKRKK